jgi:uncharacterized protein YqeY
MYVKIRERFLNSRKSRDAFAGVLSLVVSDIDSVAKASKTPATDDICIRVLNSHIKRVSEALDKILSVSELPVSFSPECPNREKNYHRNENIKFLQEEKELYLSFLPTPISQQDLANIVNSCSSKPELFKKLKSENIPYDKDMLSAILSTHVFGV